MALEMTNVTRMPGAPEPGSMLDYALRYAQMGWHVFPVWGAKDGKCRCGRECNSPAKHPVEMLVPNGQNAATTDPEIIRRWYSRMPEAGIAVFMQPSGLVGIDIDPRNGGIDTIDDVEGKNGPLISDVLQFTQGGGEHRVFSLAKDASIALPGKLGPGVDVKRNGYIVLSPTQGVSGQYAWEASSDPLEGMIPSPLPDWVRDLGQIHAPAPAVDASAPRFVTPGQLDELRSALEHIPSDDRDLWVKTGLALCSIGQAGFSLWDAWSKKSKKYDPVDAFRVWRSFKPGSINFESVFHEAQMRGWLNPLAGFVPMPELGPAATIVVPDESPALNPQILAHAPQNESFDLTIPVAALHQAVEWMEQFSEEPNRQISVHAALALASVLGGRIFESENSNVTSMYFLTLAGTGTGKGYPKEAIRRLLAESGMGHMLSGSGNTSAGAVFSALFKSPTHIQITDEFGKHLQMARRQHNAAMLDAFAVMTEAFSDANGILVPRNYSNFHLTKKELSALDSKIVYRPAITLYAFATPEQVFDNLSSAEIDDGFLNRMVPVIVNSANLPERPIGNKSVPQSLIAWVKQMRNSASQDANLAGVESDYDMEMKPALVRFSDEARKLFAEFKAEIKKTTWAEPKLTMRWRENAMRLATAMAVADSPSKPIVTPMLAKWAIDYVRASGIAFMDAAIRNIADSDFHRLYLAVKARIESASPAGLTEPELSRACHVFKKTPPHLRDNVLSAIVRDEVARFVEFRPQSGRGKSRKALVALKHLPQEAQ